MSQEEELIELSLICAGQRERIVELEDLVHTAENLLANARDVLMYGKDAAVSFSLTQHSDWQKRVDELFGKEVQDGELEAK